MASTKRIISVVAAAIFAGFLTVFVFLKIVNKIRSDQIYFRTDDCISQLNVNMGEIFAGESTEKPLSIRNMTGGAVDVITQTGCGCLKVSAEPLYLEQNKKGLLKFEYLSSKDRLRTGRVEYPFRILTQSTLNTTPTIQIIGKTTTYIHPSISIIPKKCVFRFQDEESVSSKTIQILNNTDKSLKLALDLVQEGLPSAFSIPFQSLVLEPNGTAALPVCYQRLSGDTTGVKSLIRISCFLVSSQRSHALKFEIPLVSIEDAQVATKPGSLLFYSDEIGPAKQAKLLQIEWRTKATIQKVITSSPEMVKASFLPPDTINVSVLGYPDMPLSQYVAIIYALGEKEETLKVPLVIVKK